MAPARGHSPCGPVTETQAELLALRAQGRTEGKPPAPEAASGLQRSPAGEGGPLRLRCRSPGSSLAAQVFLTGFHWRGDRRGPGRQFWGPPPARGRGSVLLGGLRSVPAANGGQRSLSPRWEGPHVVSSDPARPAPQALPESGIHIFASQLHTHLTGRSVVTVLARGGQEMEIVNRDNHYSPHFQVGACLPFSLPAATERPAPARPGHPAGCPGASPSPGRFLPRRDPGSPAVTRVWGPTFPLQLPLAKGHCSRSWPPKGLGQVYSPEGCGGSWSRSAAAWSPAPRPPGAPPPHPRPCPAHPGDPHAEEDGDSVPGECPVGPERGPRSGEADGSGAWGALCKGLPHVRAGQGRAVAW